MAKYKKIKNGMTLKKVEKIVGGKAAVRNKSGSGRDKYYYKGSKTNQYAIREVDFGINSDNKVYGKHIAKYWFELEYDDEDSPTEIHIKDYTGKSTKLIIPNKVYGLPVVGVWVDGKGLTSLDVGKCKQLWLLYCYHNKLTKIDVSNNKKLWDFKCDNNEIKTLDLRNNKELVILISHKNKIKSLSVKENKKLEFLSVDKKLKRSQMNEKLKASKTLVYPEDSYWVYSATGIFY